MPRGSSQVSVGEVFAAGGLPTHTYNARDDRHLEDAIATYLSERGRLLSVAGPSKIGKTVLLRSALEHDHPIWIEGASIRNAEDFWSEFANQLDLFTDEEISASAGLSQTEGRVGGLGGRWLSLGRSRGSGTESVQHESRSRQRRPDQLVRAAIRDPRDFVLVVDDFHHLRPDIQVEVLRSLKGIVFEGLAVILAALPHRVDDAVRAEREWVGRVETLDVPSWSQDELYQIAESGFTALRLRDDSGDLIARLAEESQACPCIMQELCRELCHWNDVSSGPNVAIAMLSNQPLGDWTDLQPPESWDTFFQARVAPGMRDLCHRLQHSDANFKEEFPGPTSRDVFQAFKRTDANQLQPETVVAESSEQVVTESGIRSVIDVFERIAERARALPGDTALDYDAYSGVLHVTDPYLAYFLRWGSLDEGAPHTHGV